MNPLEWLAKVLGITQAPLVERVNGAYYDSPQRFADKPPENSSVPAWLDQLYKSPLADSLYQIAGLPGKLGALKPSATEEGILGQTGIRGDIFLDPNKLNYVSYTPEHTLKHEIGHTLNLPKPLPAALFRYPSANSFQAGRSEIEQKAIGKIDPYGRTDPHEAFAQAFANAFDFLSKTAGNSKIDYRKLAGELESETPGMGSILQYLIQADLFRDHPLRSTLLPSKK